MIPHWTIQPSRRFGEGRQQQFLQKNNICPSLQADLISYFQTAIFLHPFVFSWRIDWGLRQMGYAHLHCGPIMPWKSMRTMFEKCVQEEDCLLGSFGPPFCWEVQWMLLPKSKVKLIFSNPTTGHQSPFISLRQLQCKRFLGWEDQLVPLKYVGYLSVSCSVCVFGVGILLCYTISFLKEVNKNQSIVDSEKDYHLHAVLNSTSWNKLFKLLIWLMAICYAILCIWVFPKSIPRG